MLISRWQANVLPTEDQIRTIFLAEELKPVEEEFEPGDIVEDHRHPFDEIRFVVSGELKMNIAGNILLLRAGDRITIPSNTKHSMANEGSELCLCLVANKPF